MERGDEGPGDLGQALRDAEGEVARLIAATARELRDRVQRKDLGSTNVAAIQALAQLVGAFYGEDGVAGLSDEYDDDDDDDEDEEEEEEEDDEDEEDEEEDDEEDDDEEEEGEENDDEDEDEEEDEEEEDEEEGE